MALSVWDLWTCVLCRLHLTCRSLFYILVSMWSLLHSHAYRRLLPSFPKRLSFLISPDLRVIKTINIFLVCACS
jgi:hypothetical protein